MSFKARKITVVEQTKSMTTSNSSIDGVWKFYRVMAFVVGFALAALTFLALPYQYLLGYGKTSFTIAAWTAHGWLFPVYLLATLLLSTRLKWPLGKTLIIMLAGTVPLMSFVAERRVAKEVDQIH